MLLYRELHRPAPRTPAPAQDPSVFEVQCLIEAEAVTHCDFCAEVVRVGLTSKIYAGNFAPLVICDSCNARR